MDVRFFTLDVRKQAYTPCVISRRSIENAAGIRKGSPRMKQDRTKDQTRNLTALDYSECTSRIFYTLHLRFTFYVKL